MAEPPAKILRLTSQKSLAHRLVLATLTGRPVHLSKIRPDSTSNPGLAPHEISFLRLLEAVTNGSHIEISYTGTTLVYKPGLITGSAPGSGASGGVIRHELPAVCARGISYFLIPLCLLSPFSKAPMNVLFTGPGVITSATQTGDVSADSVRTAILPLFAHFGIMNNIELKILRRSNAGRGGQGGAGEVQLIFGHQVRLPITIHILNPGKIKRIRGVAYCTGVSSSNNARMIDAARSILNSFTADTYIFSDVTPAPHSPPVDTSGSGQGRKSGLGFGLSLVAESSNGSLYSADVASPSAGGTPPDALGSQCAYQLLETISMGGSVSLLAAPVVLTLMSMGSEDVGRVQLGKDVAGSEALVDLARDLKAFGASSWGIREAAQGSEGDVVVSVVGKGVGNVGRKIT
ncbi:uncharacterized protein KY384_008368 [Bacidia gigantensis]|uniref:uncharacterized protein n=1 Tax=Bacidia gigantensis TaxID=2732470 RepID=UPI001D043D3C|nr:uncharacterized protein KY384_008368 [Bacidia gigantensis]KAG8526939.1 hypothetical protein KY384_008368 [Bacidia gigantensis]